MCIGIYQARSFIAAYCCIRCSNSKGSVHDCHLECRQNQDHQAKHHQMQVLFHLRCTLLEILCWQSSYNNKSKDAAISLFSDSNPISKNPKYSHSLHIPSTTYLYMSLTSACHKKIISIFKTLCYGQRKPAPQY